MRAGWTALLALLCLTFPANEARAAGIVSVYTELSPETCSSLPETEVGAGLRCQGPGGYELLAHDEDARVSVTVVTPDGTEHDLRYWHVVTRSFSAFGPRAEWRVRDGRPVALIVRVNAYEDPEHPERTTSYLVVAKIDGKSVCVTDRIAPSGDQNVRAREAADASAGQKCLGEVPR